MNSKGRAESQREREGRREGNIRQEGKGPVRVAGQGRQEESRKGGGRDRESSRSRCQVEHSLKRRISFPLASSVVFPPFRHYFSFIKLEPTWAFLFIQ